MRPRLPGRDQRLLRGRARPRRDPPARRAERPRRDAARAAQPRRAHRPQRARRQGRRRGARAARAAGDPALGHEPLRRPRAGDEVGHRHHGSGRRAARRALGSGRHLVHRRRPRDARLAELAQGARARPQGLAARLPRAALAVAQRHRPRRRALDPDGGAGPARAAADAAVDRQRPAKARTAAWSGCWRSASRSWSCCRRRSRWCAPGRSRCSARASATS